jgi:small subunit ribosomal protein S7
MPRRKKKPFLRRVESDPVTGSVVVQKLINCIMQRGKKSLARRIVYEALDIIAAKMRCDRKKGVELFERAINTVKPSVEVRPRRVGGSVYQIPVEVRPVRALALSLRWIKVAALGRSDKTMGQKLAGEIMDVLDGRGAAMKRRSDVHRMAEANRAFSHYAW